jgi:hypothetical protein
MFVMENVVQGIDVMTLQCEMRSLGVSPPPDEAKREAGDIDNSTC